jgi:hypothetical protein
MTQKAGRSDVLHPRIDLARWKAMFPLDASQPPSWDDVHGIAGPREFALYQQVLDVATDTHDLPEPVPADLCLTRHSRIQKGL